MLLTQYRKEIFRAKCNPNFQSVHCFAYLSVDIREVLPYLDAVLGGSGYTDDPPSVTFQLHGRLITVHPNKIAINALRDEEEADKVLEWLVVQINETWEKRSQIQPTYGVAPKPQSLEILRLLPKTNCGKCGQATCTVFSLLLVEGAKIPSDCPQIDSTKKEKLESYLSHFTFFDV